MIFDNQPELIGPNLRLRGLRESDRKALFHAASAPETWAGHPARDRYKPEVFNPYFDGLMAAGGTLVVIQRATDEIIGCSRFYVAADAPNDIAIGFTFVHHSHWGGRVNLAMKLLMLNHALETFERVWFHIDPSNIRSQKATAKLGAVARDDAELDLGAGLLVWKRFCLTKDAWHLFKQVSAKN